MNNLIIIVRTCGERSLNECIAKCNDITDDVHVVKEEPFYNAVIKTFEISSKSSKKFLLTLDADVRPYDGAIKKVLDYCEDKNFFRITNMVNDKFIGNGIYCGNNLINNKYSSKFYEYVLANKPSNSNKPESSSMNFFCSKYGLSELLSNVTIGSHMEDQYYHTIYNSIRNRIIKSNDTNRKKYLKNFESFVKDNPNDYEYKVALIAAKDGLNNMKYKSSFKDYKSVDSILFQLGIEEKI
tara:strand:- start:3359 stop:4078 length:720 start_codon:yes stop_codon:yes gene_type:complete